MPRKLQVAAKCNLKLLSDYWPYTNKIWQIYLNCILTISVQLSRKILQNYIKQWMSYQQEVVGDTFLARAVVLY